MDREILFRGKRKPGEEWVYGDLIREKDAFGEICTRIFQIKGNGLFRKNEVDPETVCQYTGLTDKNGRKIFEGDICEFSVFDYNDHDTQYKGIVVYSGSRFMLWKSKESEYYGYDGGFDLDWVVSQDDEFKITGNIFDNPELLNQ